MSKPNMSRLHHAIDLLGKLVAFDTTSKNSNLGLIHFVRDYLAQYGIESTLFHDETGEKANLLATIGAYRCRARVGKQLDQPGV